MATSLDAETGKLVWQERLLDHFAASPIVTGGLLYVPAVSGVTYVLRAADQFTLVAQNDLGMQTAVCRSGAGFAHRLARACREDRSAQDSSGQGGAFP